MHVHYYTYNSFKTILGWQALFEMYFLLHLQCTPTITFGNMVVIVLK